MFSIHSVSSSRELIFHSRNGDEFEVELKGGTPIAHLQVSAYTNQFGLDDLMQDLADMKKPWPGSKSWESLEGEFSISAICTTLGQVIFKVVFRNMLGTAEEWRLEFGLEVELGMLKDIGSKSRMFFR